MSILQDTYQLSISHQIKLVKQLGVAYNNTFVLLIQMEDEEQNIIIYHVDQRGKVIGNCF